MSNAVGMFLRQIVLQKGIPFEMKLPRTEPLVYGSLTKEQFDKENQCDTDAMKKNLGIIRDYVFCQWIII